MASRGYIIMDVPTTWRTHMHARTCLPLFVAALTSALLVAGEAAAQAYPAKREIAQWAKVIKQAGIKVE